MEPKARLLIPLYQYPLTDQTWRPLHEAITTHPDIEFVVVVNPNSGPGGSALPSHDYIREVPKLNEHDNVTTVGYVLINYCRRPLDDVFNDIDTYAGWVNENSTLGLKGILVDETPNHYTKARAAYLEAVGRHIKTLEGISGDRLVIHNPGTPPDCGLVHPGPDVVITCEEPYERYRDEVVQKRLREYHHQQAKSGYMISGVPEGDIIPLMHELRQRGAYLFVTELVDDFYESFGKSWYTFVGALKTEWKSV